MSVTQQRLYYRRLFRRCCLSTGLCLMTLSRVYLSLRSNAFLLALCLEHVCNNVLQGCNYGTTRTPKIHATPSSFHLMANKFTSCISKLLSSPHILFSYFLFSPRLTGFDTVASLLVLLSLSFSVLNLSSTSLLQLIQQSIKLVYRFKFLFPPSRLNCFPLMRFNSISEINSRKRNVEQIHVNGKNFKPLYFLLNSC